MRLNRLELVKVVYDILKRFGKQDLALARDIVDALASRNFFSSQEK
jgi:hypothetical protein